MRLSWTCLPMLLVPFVSGQAKEPSSGPVDFNRQVRPILSEHCFACHGPDEKTRKAKLRLDTKAGARGVLAPGKPEDSELVNRISESDPSQIMPPPKKGKALKPEQIELLRRWVKEGANWSEHWAFVPPRKPALPQLRNPKTPVRNEIDRFIFARLEKEGLTPSPEADRVTFIRRVTLDLTGLPPTPEEVDAFVQDATPQAAENLVDRLLKSPRYGEHRARYWLDAARYGDTHGLHLDNYREIWPYRDWVVHAFNDNKRYDQFLVEQLAGDLLPNPTAEQLVATGFNRCNVTTSEGGSIEEEVYVRNVVDRTETFATVTMGLTVGCARCHDHKYDPISMKEFYSLFAFFNNIEGSALDGNAARHEPTMRVAGPEQRSALERLEARAAEVRRKKAEELSKIVYDDSKDDEKAGSPGGHEYVWIDDALPAGAKTLVDGNVNLAWNFVGKPAHPVHSGERSLLVSAKGLKQVVIQGVDAPIRVGAGDRLFAYVYLSPKNPPKEIMLQWHSQNWLHRAYWGDNVIPWGRDNSTERRRVGPLPKAGEWVRLEVDAAQVGLTPGTAITGWAFTQHDGSVYWDRAGIVTKTPQQGQQFETLSDWVAAQRALGGAGLPPEIAQIVKLEKPQRTPAQRKQLRDHFIAVGWSKTKTLLAPFDQQLAAIEQERRKVEAAMPSTLIYRERKDVRPAYLLKRGEYDRRDGEVGRVTSSVLPPMPATLPRNRLGLAQWLVTPGHPLTARVAVNDLWQQFFGVGLVKTAEDFGAQGEPPSHPELLDWLAVQFVEDGWDVKKMVKRMVLSSTYRQSSRVTPERLAKDPGNRLLSRGPRHRLDAETLRDQALFVSGLMFEKLGGPGVKPPQPSGLWEAVGYTGSNTYRFMADVGHEKVHRRSLYTFWKRTAPPPTMSTFDAPSREACRVRRERTNTPLQALLLLNETQYVEAARALAERTMLQGGTTPEKRIAYLFRLATSRKPHAGEQATLLEAYRAHLAEFTKDVAGARKLIEVVETKPDATLNPSELAAWTMIANVVLNLDEVLTKG